MTLPSFRLALPAVALFTLLACSGNKAQQSVDTFFIKQTVGQKYSELMSRSGFKVRVDYGREAVSANLPDGGAMHLHVQEYESGSSEWFGLWGKVRYSYKLNAFRVNDDVVKDWAYGLYTPPEEASTILGIEFGYKRKTVMERIKLQYPDLVKTSANEPIMAWNR